MLQIPFCSRYGLRRFRVANQCDVVEGIVSLPPHTVKQGKCWGQRWVEMLLRKLDDGNMVTELDARPLTVAQHQR